MMIDLSEIMMGKGYKKRGSVKRNFFSAFVIVASFIILFSTAEGAGQNFQSSSWEKARTALENFLNRPDSFTAWELMNSIPSEKGDKAEKEKFINYLNLSFLYEIFQLEMAAGNKYAARAILRLLPFLEGSIRWKLTATLAELVRMNPWIFLRACYEERDGLFIRTQGYPVSQLSDFMWNKEIAYYELQQRKEALKSVEDIELRSIRNRCLRDIEIRIKNLGLKNLDLACGKREPTSADNLIQNIKASIDEILRLPCPGNFKQLLELLPERPTRDIIGLLAQTFFVLRMSPDVKGADAFALTGYESLCGNEYAFEVLLYLLRFCHDWQCVFTQNIAGEVLIIRPALFIEKIFKYQAFLQDTRMKAMLEGILLAENHYINELSIEKKISALERLKMPQYKEVIGYCIRVLQEYLKNYRKIEFIYIPKKRSMLFLQQRLVENP